MNFAAKVACFLLFHLVAANAVAQATASPTGLTATYKKYVNRIELIWQATGSNQRYIIQRSEGGKHHFQHLDTIAQNRYVDRNKLKVNTDYLYSVLSLDPNGMVSAPSNVAVGALLAVADGNIGMSGDSTLLGDCLKIDFTEIKVLPRHFLLKFLAKSNCAQMDMAQLTLFWSPDPQLDPTDQVLATQLFNLTRTRGALSGINKGAGKGYLLLEAASNGSSFVLSIPVN